MKVSSPASHDSLHQTAPPPGNESSRGTRPVIRPANATPSATTPNGSVGSPPPPAIRRASGGLRFLGTLLLFSTLSLLSCQSLFVF